jgi:hypothetical protein
MDDLLKKGDDLLKMDLGPPTDSSTTKDNL